jgi:hypothetical protein
MTFLGWELNPNLSIHRPTLYRLSHLVLELERLTIQERLLKDVFPLS